MMRQVKKRKRERRGTNRVEVIKHLSRPLYFRPSRWCFFVIVLLRVSAFGLFFIVFEVVFVLLFAFFFIPIIVISVVVVVGSFG